MKEIATNFMPYLIALAVVLAFLAYAKSERFFSALLAVQPEALDEFRRGTGLREYGPIAPEKFRYLNSKRFYSLQDPRLRAKGVQAYFALAAYTAAFVILLFSALVSAS